MAELSVVIPVYNRGELIRYTLESVRRAGAGLELETIVVDDGSTPPAAESIARLGFTPDKIVRQENRGLLFARLAGFAHATGRHTLFLDSDDLVSAEKFRAQLAAMAEHEADVSYTDVARCELSGGYDALAIQPDAPTREVHDSARFFLEVQPPPHSPIFRTDFLRDIVAQAFIEPSPLYNPVAEIWFYHNAAPHAARVVKVPGPHTIIGFHPGTRLTNHWERLAVASLAVMEAFARECPRTPESAHARQIVGEVAFRSWRKLPLGFSREIDDRHLGLWKKLGPRRAPGLGGPTFQAAALLLGGERAARWLRRATANRYDTCRTTDDATLEKMLRALPPP
jgi:hypothetical protein